MEAARELTVQAKACPPLLWSLTSFIEGYDAQTDTLFETGGNEDFSLINAVTRTGSPPPGARTFVSGGAWIGEPPHEH